MKITKLGHCCLLIQDQDRTILTDPGAWTEKQNDLTGINVILITHEHQDHFHIDSVKKVLKNNPQAVIVTNSAVGKFLDKEEIKYEVLEHGNSKAFGQVLIEGFGNTHADIYKSIPPVQNTGYFISNRLFYPGDAFTDPGKSVEVLALPVAGPWLHISETIDYALRLRPKYAFPVHDGLLKFPGPHYSVPKRILEPEGIKFIESGANGEINF